MLKRKIKRVRISFFQRGGGGGQHVSCLCNEVKIGLGRRK